jgi:CRISPR-associated protein Cmr6
MAKNKKEKFSLKDLGAALGQPLVGTSGEVDQSSAWDLPDHQRIPLQVLKLDDFVERYQTRPNDERMNLLLNATASADQHWQSLYDSLCGRVLSLAAVLEPAQSGKSVQRAIAIAEFRGYTRVGGFPGFWERLLPVMHPIYGVPYVPASSIKGAVKAWARSTNQADIDRLLGYLHRDKAAIATVEFLDAFPMQPCLKVDVATPQWKWDGDVVKYGPAPHQLLSLENLKLQIGLRQTSKGTIADVKTVMGWLEEALLQNGLGSRISAGYGRAGKVNGKTVAQIKPTNHYASRHSFEFWSQGMYGLTPPCKANHYEGVTEFRVTAVRGILRYWFRAIALGVFSPQHCQMLEQILFGTLEPKARHGHIRVSVCDLVETSGSKSTLHQVSGTIVLEATTPDELDLMEKLLCLATHVGGVGRGSRRPLHVNQDGNRRDLRGCYWQLTDSTMNLGCDAAQWSSFLMDLMCSLERVKSSAFDVLKQKEPKVYVEIEHLRQLAIGSPTRGDSRCQDVLNANARIYLLPVSSLKHPSKAGWENLGSRGSALDFLYKKGYKGKSKSGTHNEKVGGKLEVPSFVWITSNYPQDSSKSYQVVTIFGVNQEDRAKFCQDLADEHKKSIVEVKF